MIVIEKIISGGQTGADRGGLDAAVILGIPVGGTAPHKYMTERGSDYSLRDLGLREGAYDPKVYPKRTLRNIMDSDGTVVFGNINSPGSRQTIQWCRIRLTPCICNPSPDGLYDWVQSNNIKVLNVAGNRESKTPGIHDSTVQTLLLAFGRMVLPDKTKAGGNNICHLFYIAPLLRTTPTW